MTLPVVMTTYLDLPRNQREARISAAWEVMNSFTYQGLDVGFIIVHDGDGSSRGEFARSKLVEEYWNEGHKGVGASLNRGFQVAFNHASVALYVVDDWRLTERFYLQPWIKLLEDHEDIGAVRLGPPHPDLTGIVKHYDGTWALRLDRHHFAFSHRPTLFHQRFLQAYGPMPEGRNAYDTEWIYNEHFCDTPGPDIVYALPYPWEHIETCELADIEPGSPPIPGPETNPSAGIKAGWV